MDGMEQEKHDDVQQARFGYVRVSVGGPEGDNIETQRRVLRGHGVHDGLIFSDVCSGSIAPSKRPGWQDLKNRLRPGDTLVIKHPDRLARNMLDGMMEMRDLDDAGILVVVSDFGGGTGNDAIDRMMMQVSLVWAEWAARDTSRRIKEGQARAREQGKSIGRPTAYQDGEFLKDQAKRMKANGLNPSEIARRLSDEERTISRSTVRWWLGEIGGAK